MLLNAEYFGIPEPECLYIPIKEQVHTRFANWSVFVPEERASISDFSTQKKIIFSIRDHKVAKLNCELITDMAYAPTLAYTPIWQMWCKMILNNSTLFVALTPRSESLGENVYINQ